MATRNESIVDLCQNLTETNQEQGKHIYKLITQIEALTKLFTSNGTKALQQEEGKNRRQKNMQSPWSISQGPWFFWELGEKIQE